VGIHVHGVRIVIEVVEKTLPPEKEEGRDTDLIARIGGKIEELLVLKGTPLVEEGDEVKKGQTLISGLVYPEIIISETGEISPAGEAQIIKARGLVRALVQRSYLGQCPFREKIVWDTGLEKRTIFLRLGEKEIYLKGTKENPYPQYRLVRRVKPLFVLRGKKLSGSLEIVSIIYKEQVCQTKEWGIEGAFQEAARRAQDLVWGEVPGQHKIISQKFEPLFEPEKETLSVRYVLETIEEIGTYGF